MREFEESTKQSGEYFLLSCHCEGKKGIKGEKAKSTYILTNPNHKTNNLKPNHRRPRKSVIST